MTKVLRLLPVVLAATALSGCSVFGGTSEAGDPPEVTCERFHGVIDDFQSLDPETIGAGDLLGKVSGGFTEMRTLVEDAADPKLAESITTLTETLNSSIASAKGNVTAMLGEVETSMQDQDVHDAVSYLTEVCGDPLGNA